VLWRDDSQETAPRRRRARQLGSGPQKRLSLEGMLARDHADMRGNALPRPSMAGHPGSLRHREPSPRHRRDATRSLHHMVGGKTRGKILSSASILRPASKPSELSRMRRGLVHRLGGCVHIAVNSQKPAGARVLYRRDSLTP